MLDRKVSGTFIPGPRVTGRGGKATRRQVLRWGAVGGASLLGLDAFAYEPNALGLRGVTLPIVKLPRAFEGYRIAFVTDVHYPRRIAPEFIGRAMAMARAFRPDLILHGGDFVDRKGGSDRVPSLAGLFESAAPDGVFGVLGNHDHWFDAAAVRRELARSSPVRLLENEHAILSRGDDRLVLGGLEDLWGGKPDLTKTFAGAPEDAPRILLSHNPDTAEACAGAARVDLQISGHTHGGEVVLPLVGPPHIPSRYGRKFERGYVRGALHPVYVSVGVASPRGVRFRCPPEVTVITLIPA